MVACTLFSLVVRSTCWTNKSNRVSYCHSPGKEQSFVAVMVAWSIGCHGHQTACLGRAVSLVHLCNLDSLVLEKITQMFASPMWGWLHAGELHGFTSSCIAYKLRHCGQSSENLVLKGLRLVFLLIPYKTYQIQLKYITTYLTITRYMGRVLGTPTKHGVKHAKFLRLFEFLGGMNVEA